MEKESEGEIKLGDLGSSLLTSEDTESLASDVENMIPSGLEMPAFTWRTMKQLFTKCVAEPFSSVEQTTKGQALSAENSCLLNTKCHLIVEMISHEILRAVIPQVLTQDGSNNLRYTHVTEGDILHSFGYSLDIGIREAMSLTGVQSIVSVNKLKQLIATEVANTVNCSLDLVIDRNAIEMEPHKCMLMHPKKIVDLLRLILISYDPKRPESAPKDNAVGLKDLAKSSHQMLDDKEKELLARDRNFIAKFIPALVTCITARAKTSMYDLDLRGMLARLEECTVGKLSYTFPKNIEQIHITVYKKLCREFGCAKQQHAAIVSVDRFFEATIVRLLKEQLHRPEKDGFVDKMKKIFKKGSHKSIQDSEEAGTSASYVNTTLTPEKSPLDKSGQH